MEDLKTLEQTIHGMEFKPLPFMLCVTNRIEKIMSFIEHLDADNWQQNFQLFFEGTLAVLEI